MKNLLSNLKPELHNTLRNAFKVFHILNPGGRVVKSKTGKIYREFTCQRKEIFIKTYIDTPIMFN